MAGEWNILKITLKSQSLELAWLHTCSREAGGGGGTKMLQNLVQKLLIRNQHKTKQTAGEYN